jgi:hypothetical protein
MMRIHVIEGTKVTAYTAAPARLPKAAKVIRSAEDLDKSGFSPQKLVGLWNGLPDVAPVKKFKDHKTAVHRLWVAFQKLAPVPEATAPSRNRRAAGGKTAERKQREDSKQAQVIAMLRRPTGATLDDLIAATGWQRHTVRGVLSGALKKRLGLTIQSEKTTGSPRTYRIA